MQPEEHFQSLILSYTTPTVALALMIKLLLWTTVLFMIMPPGLLAAEMLCLSVWNELVGVVADKVN